MCNLVTKFFLRSIFIPVANNFFHLSSSSLNKVYFNGIVGTSEKFLTLFYFYFKSFLNYFITLLAFISFTKTSICDSLSFSVKTFNL